MNDLQDLFQSFAKLMHNRAFMTAMMNVGDIGSDDFFQNGRGQAPILHLLEKSPDGLTNTEITEIMDIRPSSVSSTINRLEEAGLVERKSSKSDKRVSIIYLSEKGKEIANNRDKEITKLGNKVFGSLTSQEQVELVKLLNKLNDNMADLDIHELMKFNNRYRFSHRHGFGHPHDLL